MVVGAFLDGAGRPTTANVAGLFEPAFPALWQSIVLSAVTAVAGAVIGAVLAYAVAPAAGRHPQALRHLAVRVLAQFGGVALAFAFMASFGGPAC